MEGTDGQHGEQGAHAPVGGGGDVEDGFGVAGTAQCAAVDPGHQLRNLNECGDAQAEGRNADDFLVRRILEEVTGRG